MISKEHKKHAAMVKPAGGRFHRNEIAILGAPCSIIQSLSERIAHALAKSFRVGYVDADHSGSDYSSAYVKKYTDKIDHHRLEMDPADLTYEFRQMFSSEDVVLVNGNHFTADTQVVLINEKKKESLSRKLDRLTHVAMIILDEGESEIYDFVKERLPSGTTIPVVSIEDTVAITGVLKKLVLQNLPSLKGLVLAGGESTRMGKDKGAITYHGKPQREYVAELMGKFCTEVFISSRSDRPITSDYPCIEDTFTGLGPYGGILSAFRKDPNAGWLTVACDIPLINEPTVHQLVENRNSSRVATCFHNPETQFPEPLITIWEPRAYPRLLYFLSLGYSCPRKVLINSEIHELQLPDAAVLTNVNTPEEYERMKSQLNG